MLKRKKFKIFNFFLTFRNENDWQGLAKIIFIENQIKLCQAINSPEELKHWYKMLMYHLAIGGNESRIRLILNELLSGSPLSLILVNIYNLFTII